jgi:hypothetical protein
VSKVECTFHSGQVPPNFENGNVPDEKRFETLPALSTQQEERHAAGVRPLQRGEAMADLLKPALKRCASTCTS